MSKIQKKYHFYDREPDGMFPFAELHPDTRRNLEYLESVGFSWGTIIRYWVVTPNGVNPPKKSIYIKGSFQGVKIEYWRYVPPSTVFCPTLLYVHGRRTRFNVPDLIALTKRHDRLPESFLQQVDLAKENKSETLIDWALKQKHYSSTTLKLEIPKVTTVPKERSIHSVAVCGARRIKIISF